MKQEKSKVLSAYEFMEKLFVEKFTSKRKAVNRISSFQAVSSFWLFSAINSGRWPSVVFFTPRPPQREHSKTEAYLIRKADFCKILSFFSRFLVNIFLENQLSFKWLGLFQGRSMSHEP